MAYQLFRLPKAVGLDSAVRALSGAKAYFYETGTTTPQDTYSDAELTTPHAHPVVADSSGVFPPIYLDPSRQYKLTLNNSADVLIYTVDPVNDRHGVSYDRTAAEIAAGVTPTDYAFPPGDVRRYGAVADGVTDSYTAFYNACLSNRSVTIPEGAFFLSETLIIDSSMFVRRLEGASGTTTLILMDTGKNGIDLDREQMQLANISIRPAVFESDGSEIVAGTQGVINRRSFNEISHVQIRGFEVGARQSSRYHSVWRHVRSFDNDYGIVIGKHGDDTLNPNNNTFYACGVEHCFKIGVDVREGRGNVLDRCDLENLPGTTNLQTNFDNDTWGLKVATELSVVRCWLEGCRWFATRDSSGIFFDDCTMDGSHASGAMGFPCRVRITKYNPSQNLITLTSFNQTTTNVTSADTSNQAILTGSRGFGADVRKYTVASGAGVAKVITNGGGTEIDPYLPGETLHIAWGMFVKKSVGTANTRVEITFRDHDDSVTFQEGSAQLHVATENNTDWQYIGGYYLMRTGEFTGSLCRRIVIGLRLDETSADWSGGTALEVEVAAPMLRVINWPTDRN